MHSLKGGGGGEVGSCRLFHHQRPCKRPCSASAMQRSCNASVKLRLLTPNWVYHLILLKTSVYQSNLFLVITFNTVMCTLVDSLKFMTHLGYQFFESLRATYLLQYADGTCLIGKHAASCMKLLDGVQQRLDWSGIKAMVLKSHSLHLQAAIAKTITLSYPCMAS